MEPDCRRASDRQTCHDAEDEGGSADPFGAPTLHKSICRAQDQKAYKKKLSRHDDIETENVMPRQFDSVSGCAKRRRYGAQRLFRLEHIAIGRGAKADIVARLFELGVGDDDLLSCLRDQQHGCCR